MKLPTGRRVFDVVGESRTNPDGVGRQDVLCDVEPGELVELIREPGNSHDGNAVRVVIHGHTVGYLTREDAAELAPALDAGRAHRVIVHSIRGGVPDYPSYGCQVSVAWDGRSDHPFVKLDEQQLRSRRSKKAARTRRRAGDAGKRSSSTQAARNGSGCLGLGLAVLIATPLLWL